MQYQSIQEIIKYKKIMNCYLEGKSSVARLEVRLIDVVNNDMRKTGVRNWKRILYEGKAH
jgi:hypothetical protein